MRLFARIDGRAVVETFPTIDYPEELIPADGDIRSLFHPSLVWVEITGMNPVPMVGWSYADGGFSAPKPYEPSQEEILAENKTARDSLLDMATRAINPLLDAVDAGVATVQEKAALSALRSFRIFTNRVDLTELNPTWPAFPE